MQTRTNIADAAKDRAWHAFRCEPHRSLDDIAAELGIGRTTLHHRRIEWGWPPRNEAVAAAHRDAADRLPGLDPALAAMVPLGVLAAGADPGGAMNFRDLARRLRRMLFGQLDDIKPKPGHFDRILKTLGTIPKTVDAIQALERLDVLASDNAADPDGADHDEPPPRSLDELRQELARHLDRLEQEEALERRFGDADGEGPGEPA
jgi:hypothetical protein